MNRLGQFCHCHAAVLANDALHVGCSLIFAWSPPCAGTVALGTTPL
jgi:hypothetical protein